MQGIVEAKNPFEHAGYAILRGLVPQPVSGFLFEYVLKSARIGRMKLGDSGVPGSPNYYSDAFMESLLELLLPEMEAASGKRLLPTYSYVRLYKRGDVLKRHQDRPSCEISATLNLGYAALKPWPIWIEAGGEARSISLEPGDAMLYKGIDVPHWRDQFDGEHSAQVFLHYVDRTGPHRDFAFDKRKSLGSSETALQILRQLMRSAVEGPGNTRKSNETPGETATF